MKKYLQSILLKVGWHLTSVVRAQQSASAADAQALHLLPALDLPYLPWTEPALRPSALKACLNEISIHQRTQVAEFGSGISTLMLASFLSERNGTLLTIEHDAEWLNVVRQYLQELEVPTSAYTLVHAPLSQTQEYAKHRGTPPWYDTARLDEAVSERTFDMVLVDGPSANTKKTESVRYLALPYLQSQKRLKEDFVVLLDDISRTGEQRIARDWKHDYDLTLDVNPGNSGLGILRPKNGRPYYTVA